jgi:ferredoxin
MDEHSAYLPRAGLQALLDLLNRDFDRCLGPTVVDDSIVFRPITEAAQLPRAVRDRQAPGRYRLDSSGDDRLFAWANGPQALKPLLFAPSEPLWRVVRQPDGQLDFQAQAPEVVSTAVIGVRACDLAALRLQDQHFLDGPHADPYYRARREELLLVAVDCSHPADTCFCASTGDGPGCGGGADLVLTELDEGFLVRAGSEPGRAIADRLPLQQADAEQCRAGHDSIAAAAAAQARRLPDADLPVRLFAAQDHPHWERVAQRCLSCGNCTLVCPSCFCHRSEELPALGGASSEHHRVWDSCFSPGHAHLHGAHLRESTRDQYRQWLTHKFAGWVEQYGRSGCTGCGRCISWCPVGIDVTAELAALTGDAP